ncbi:MAG: hypothetical protein AB7Q00_10520 [Phycisphaerales bacterium]|nr:MAG: SRPBCC family protein [Phycisphaerales bacterium]
MACSDATQSTVRALAPVCFACRRRSRTTLQEIADAILDLENWSSFTGWGPLPGIRSARFVTRSVEFVGTVFAVTDTRGDTYTESITRWDPETILEIRMDGFVTPLSNLSTHFFERWTIEHDSGASSSETGMPVVVRSFEMYPKSRIARPALWFIGQMMRRAVDRHSARVLA